MNVPPQQSAPPQQQVSQQQQIAVQDYQARQDAEHLNVLSILYIVFGVFVLIAAAGAAAYGCLMGLFMATASAPVRGDGIPPAAFPFGAFTAMAIMFGALLGAVGWLMIYAGKCLKQRRQWTWIIVAGALCCLHAPLGTLLGIFTFVVLSRPSVKALFPQP